MIPFLNHRSFSLRCPAPWRALLAAGVLAAAATQAHAAFTFTLSGPTVSGSFSIYDVYAFNNGGTTGTRLTTISSTIATGGATTATALRINLTDTDGDGANDANVAGSGLTLSSPYSYQRVGTITSFILTTVTPSPYTTDPGGTGAPTQSINAAYTAGNVHSLLVTGTNLTGVAANTGQGAFFAQVAVPTGTAFTVSGSVGGDAGSLQSFSVASTVPEPSAWAMVLGASAAGLFIARRRRKNFFQKSFGNL